MQVKLSYSKNQLEEAVKFIGDNNQFFIGQYDLIRSTILKYMIDFAKNKDLSTIGSMGFFLTADFNEESVDYDENTLDIDIHVDPNLGKEFGELVQEVIEI